MRHGQTQVKEELLIDNSNVADRLDKDDDNAMLLAFRHAITESLTLQNMVDGRSDEYEDEDGMRLQFQKLLLHFDGTDGATSTTDDSPSAHSSITFRNNAQLDTAQKKFGTASLLLDGVADDLILPDSPDWQVTTDFTVHLWARHVDHAGIENYVSHGHDDIVETNRWFFRHEDIIGLKFLWRALTGEGDGAVEVIGGEITDSNFHHVAICKVGSDYGIYLDGVQTAYVSDFRTNTSEGLLYIGQDSDEHFFNGHMDDIEINTSNIFNAIPVQALTDTITVPISAVNTQTEFTINQTYDSVNDLYASEGNNMILVSDSFIAEAEPNNARLIIFEESIDSVTLNTDIKGFISRDGGSTFSEITLVDIGNYESGKRILGANADLTESGIGSGTNMVYKIKILNNKSLNIHGAGLTWD